MGRMRLLIVTQKVDKADPVLGFFHRWLRFFAEADFANVTVIAQQVGPHDLEKGMTVLSLKKEEGLSRIRQVFRFWRLIWSQREEYDAVLVHMTPIWVVLGFPVWKLSAKPVYLWYEARGARWPLRAALLMVNKAFSASPAGMPVRTKKSVIVGHGIDTGWWNPGNKTRDPGLIISVSRISPSKRIGLIIEALAQLPSQYRLKIIGRAVTPREVQEKEYLQKVIREKSLEQRVTFDHMSPDGLRELEREASLLLHASSTSLDKAVLEAMSCGCLVVSCAEAVRGVLPERLRSSTEHLGDRALQVLSLSESDKEALRKELKDIVMRDHGLKRLVERLYLEMAQ